MKYFFSLSIIISVACLCIGQKQDRKITFPDVQGYKTLKCDLHIHTVFSDGYVWPNIRVDEAVRDGLDAIALTEHIEYQPKIKDIPHKDRNRSYEIAKEAAKPHDLIVIHGTEITRSMPPGHANALFVQDVNKIMVDDAYASYKEARAQGAFIFWNHPHWINQKKDGLPEVTEMHKKLIREDLLHGIEVVNDVTYSEEGIQLAQDYNLTMLGTSDIHGLIDYQYEVANGGHRPITLIFAKSRSEAGIKDALFEGRTITWFNNILTGNQKVMQLLMDASITVTNKGLIGDSDVLEIELSNSSDARLFLKNTSVYDFHKNTDIIELMPHGTTKLQVLLSRSKNTEALTFEILNAVIGYKKHFNLSIDLK